MLFPTSTAEEPRTKNSADVAAGKTHRQTIRRERSRSLLSLESPALAPALSGLGSALGIEQPVPPDERGGVVADELLMVNVVVVGTGPDGEEVVQGPGELVAGVRVDGLENAQHDPHVHGQDVQVLGDGAPQDGRADRAQAEDHDFDGRGVLGREAEGRGVLVVDLVDVLVQRAPVHGAVGPVVPGVLEHEEDGDLIGHGPDGGEGNGGREAAVLRHGVEAPDLRQFDGEVRDEDEFRALPLLSRGGDLLLWKDDVSSALSSRFPIVLATYVLNLVLVEVGYPVDDDPGQTAAEVDDLVHEEAHDAGGEDIVADVGVPRSPHTLEVVEVDIVLGDLVELVPVGVGRVRQHDVRDRVVGGIVTVVDVSTGFNGSSDQRDEGVGWRARWRTSSCPCRAEAPW